MKFLFGGERYSTRAFLGIVFCYAIACVALGVVMLGKLVLSAALKALDLAEEIQRNEYQ